MTVPMLNRQISKLAQRSVPWRLIHGTLGGLVLILIVVLILQLVIPARLSPHSDKTQLQTNLTNAGWLSQILKPKSADFGVLSRLTRRGLFRAAAPLRDKPMAEKTIERIKSQLQLQCIMEIGGEPVAYINIKGDGLKKCRVGDCISDLFTVVAINKQSVETTIIGHKVTLAL